MKGDNYALTKKCDRCGKLYEEYNTKEDCKKINGIALLNIDCHEKYYLHGPFDLCPDCKDSFDEWLANKNKDGGFYFIHANK